MAVYPKAAGQAEQFRAGKSAGELSWPDWCYMPVAGSYAILSEVVEQAGVSMADAIPDIGNLAAMLAWRPLKGVYRFDPALLESLWGVTLDREIPVDVLLNLPEWCCYIDLEGFGPADDMELLGFFVYLEADANTGKREIRLSFARPGDTGPGINTLPFHLDTGGTIGAMLQGTVDFARLQAPEAKALQDATIEHAEAVELYSRYFSLVLYLCSAERDIIQTSKPRKVAKNPKKRKRQLPVEYRVGSAIGGAIRRARGSQRTGTGEGTKKAPHIRKAHYHTFWTGKKGEDKKPIVKFIAPIPINIGDEPVVPIVRRVK